MILSSHYREEPDASSDVPRTQEPAARALKKQTQRRDKEQKPVLLLAKRRRNDGTLDFVP